MEMLMESGVFAMMALSHSTVSHSDSILSNVLMPKVELVGSSKTECPGMLEGRLFEK